VRITAGRLRGKTLAVPEGRTIRPTADRTRQSLFNIIDHGRAAKALGVTLRGARVLDAFAGTGALGLEALSRGAGFVSFMENQAGALNACQTNIEALGEAANAELLRCDVLRPPKATAPCALVLMDPPYNQDLAPPALAALRTAGWLAPGALAAVELMAKEPFAPPEGFETRDERKYGKARLVFLRAPE